MTILQHLQLYISKDNKPNYVHCRVAVLILCESSYITRQKYPETVSKVFKFQSGNEYIIISLFKCFKDIDSKSMQEVIVFCTSYRGHHLCKV